ncbi:GntR family transcriptional regulator (plasmid) [Peteryoungia desertarenae]|uniref:GntR family transcriptional regulator n=1 Tax=Peteryoungia desertarenae TaxID=1813451 RepID=A0ABX6QTX8_9HYPH|nr:GntR family transcriptional regulator [Peteryoungia desertarenae]QLF72033.1 GntR family transcriptional regulator [Peteryoungia desertarenae]
MPLIDQKLPDLGSAPTASDLILKHLRTLIVDGTLDEGEPIRQDEIAGMFNVSKIPVREALKRLEAEGLVAFRRNRGAVVTALSEPEIVEMFEVRAILEASAIRFSVPHLSESRLSEAQELCDAFANETDASKWADLNWRFHSCLYEDAQRPYLVGMIRSVNDRLERYLRIQLSLSHGQSVADREHRDILSLCRAGHADGAADLVYAHILGACHSLMTHLPPQTKRDDP